MRSDRQQISLFRKIFISSLIILILLLAGYLVVLNMATKKAVDQINNTYSQEESKDPAADEILFTNNEFLELQRKKNFLQSRIIMADDDSVNLSLNLRDSIASLEIHGVPVYSSHISQIAISNVFRKAEEYAVVKMFSKPFRVKEYYATIKKESLIINIAPKDTIEANVPEVVPDTAAVEAASFILIMENNLKLYVYHEENDTISDKTLFQFDLKDRTRFLKSAVKSVVDLKVPEYQPYIKIRMSKEEVKIIYTAIASHALVSIFF